MKNAEEKGAPARKLTACCRCRHALRLSLHVDPNIWWNWICLAAPGEKRFDAVTGFVTTIAPFCRDINKGDCRMYEEKE